MKVPSYKPLRQSLSRNADPDLDPFVTKLDARGDADRRRFQMLLRVLAASAIASISLATEVAN